MHFYENHATTLSEHHIIKEKGITENKVDYVYVMIGHDCVNQLKQAQVFVVVDGK